MENIKITKPEGIAQIKEALLKMRKGEPIAF